MAVGSAVSDFARRIELGTGATNACLGISQVIQDLEKRFLLHAISLYIETKSIDCRHGMHTYVKELVPMLMYESIFLPDLFFI